MTLIDLGELRDVEHPESPARARPAVRRFPLLLAVVVAALATLAASAPPSPRDVVVVPFLLGADRIVADDLLLVVDPPNLVGAERGISAYRLSDGEPVWQAPLPVSGMFWGVVAEAGLLLVTGYDPEAHNEQTVALDARTGTFRWQQSGRAEPVAGGGLLLAVLRDDGSGTLRFVDACCGRTRWQAPVPVGGPMYRSTDGGIDRVVLSDPRGRVEVRDAATGAVLSTADLGPAVHPGSIGGPPGRQWTVVADQLVAVDGARVTAYEMARLARRWTATLPEALYATDCGTVVCLHTASDVLLALDTLTGRSLWSRRGSQVRWSEPGLLIVTPVTTAGTSMEDLVLLDPVTGDVRAELGRWELAPRWTGDGPLFAVRPHPAGGLVVAEVDLVAATLRLRDVLPEAAGDCQVVGDGLLCRRRDASLGLWRFRR